MPNEQDHIGRRGAPPVGIMQKTPTTLPLSMTAEEDLPADVDEPPEQGRAPRPSPLTIRHSSQASFSKSKPRIDRKESLLTTALQSTSNVSSPVDDQQSPARGMSCVSTWSNNSISTAELTSDGGLTSPGTRACTPSPPLPSSTFHNMIPPFAAKPFERSVSVVRHDDENITVSQNAPPTTTGEQGVEATLGRKRCIMFACGKQAEKKPAEETPKPALPPPSDEPPKRACTIKFACPTKISTEAPSKPKAPRPRAASPAPLARRIPSSPRPSPRHHRDSDSTVRNSPVSVRKVPVVDRVRRLSMNSDLAHCEAYRFHEFASSEEEIEEWTQESTCHRSRLTVSDTLKVENNLRQLVEEAEEEALEDDDDDDDDGMDADEEDDDDDDDEDDDDDDDNDAYSDATDEGFQTDDENGFAVSDDESDAGSNYNWWAPGASTAATSVDHIGHLRTKNHRTVSESSIGSLESRKGFQMFDRAEGPSLRRRKSRPVNIRGPSPELPDSTDFVCGTLDEDRPAEAAYMVTLERRRAAKHKPTPQDIDPTFPASDPELVDDDEEDEVDEVEADKLASESDCLMLPGRMELAEGETRGRRRSTIKQPPALSPPAGGRRNVYRSPPPTKRTVHRSPPPAKRVVHRSPPPPVKRTVHRSPAPAKRAVHRSPPPNGLFGASPRRRSPAPVRLRSPPPTRRGSANILASRQRTEMSIRFGGIGERPALVTSASLPRTPIAAQHNPLEYDEDETSTNDMPVRRAIDIQVGLEKKRQRRKEQLYRKQHRKGMKEKRPPPPGRGAERMRGIGLQVAAHKGKTTAVFNPFQMATTPDQKDMHVLSV